MAQITITVPDANVQDILDSFKWKFNKRDTVMLQGETDGQYGKRMVAKFVQDVYIEYKKAVAAQAAEDSAQAVASAVVIS